MSEVFPYDVVVRRIDDPDSVALGAERVRLLNALMAGETLARHEAGVVDELGAWSPVTRERIRWTGYWNLRPCGDCAGYPGHFTDCAIHGGGRRDLD